MRNNAIVLCLLLSDGCETDHCLRICRVLSAGPRMPWDRNNVVEYNNVHSIDGIMGDGGAM